MKRTSFAFLIFSILVGVCAFAADAEFIYSGSSNYSLTERTDLRRYDNGKYFGLVSREISSFIVCNGGVYDGDFYVSQDTVRNKKVVDTGIHESIHSIFKIEKDGRLVMIEDNGFPSFRSFPTFSNKKIQIGQSWQAQATRCVDPLNKGVPTRMPIQVEYTYLKDEVFHGEDVFVLSAKWATRYGDASPSKYRDPAGDRTLQKATGGHNATMYIRKSDCAALVIRDSVDETFVYSDGNQYAFRGTISLFTEYPPAIDDSILIDALRRAELVDDAGAKYLAESKPNGKPSERPNFEDNPFGTYNGQPTNTSTWLEGFGKGKPTAKKADDKPKQSSKKNDSTTKPSATTNNDKISGGGNASVTVEKTNGGIKLTIQNLHFKPDLPDLLPGEENLLNKIASVLKQAPNNKLLIEGHTADTGNPTGEMQLSIERAKTIAAELAKRGINSDLFICRGSGSKKPIADNSTKEGMAQNRRVEITILE